MRRGLKGREAGRKVGRKKTQEEAENWRETLEGGEMADAQRRRAFCIDNDYSNGSEKAFVAVKDFVAA